jgi:POT family proton-dependent oligopeptide transporter
VKQTNPRPGEWLVYPKGALLVIGVEFWERFSFYGMLSILVLFSTGSPIHGGFGWPAAQALGLLGATAIMGAACVIALLLRDPLLRLAARANVSL